jgi:putative Mg2+ transporter-C (MgtC) family protein
MGSAVEQATLLGVAFVLTSIIGLERELRNHDAGLRTHALVGLGAALFTLAGRFGFDDGAGSVDATRIAAQVVSGIGFIGAGVIFTRRDGVRGLTTAATVWLSAAVGLAAGAGSVALAVLATSCHLVIAIVFTPLVRRMPRSRLSLASVEVSYHDGRGVLRDVLAATTALGYVVSEVQVTRHDALRDVVSVSLDAEGRRDPKELVDALHDVGGVTNVRSRHPAE